MTLLHLVGGLPKFRFTVCCRHKPARYEWEFDFKTYFMRTLLGQNQYGRQRQFFRYLCLNSDPSLLHNGRCLSFILRAEFAVIEV